MNGPRRPLFIRASSQSEPHSDGGEGDQCQVSQARFLEAGSNGPIRFKSVKAALNLVAVFIDFFVVWEVRFSVFLAGNHGLCPGQGDLVTQVVCIAGLVSQHLLPRAQVAGQQGGRPADSPRPGPRSGLLTGGQAGASQLTCSLVEKPPRLRPGACGPFFSTPRPHASAPGQWWNRLATGSAPSRLATPLRLWPISHYASSAKKRTNTRCQGPNRSGRSRHGTPQRSRQRMASTNKRVSFAVTPGLCAWPGNKGDNRAHCASVSNVRSAFMS